MTVAIAVYNSDGCVGRCDAKCHNATAPACDCAGASQAQELLRDLLPDELRAEIDRFEKRNGYEAGSLTAGTIPTLFDQEAIA